MKRTVMISTVLAAVLFGTTALTANSLTDVGAKKEATALMKGKVKGEAAAEKTVEAVTKKETLEAKHDKNKFAKEAKADEKKVDTITEVKEIEKEDQQVAKKKIKTFEEEAKSDLKKKLK